MGKGWPRGQEVRRWNRWLRRVDKRVAQIYIGECSEGQTGGEDKDRRRTREKPRGPEEAEWGTFPGGVTG